MRILVSDPLSEEGLKILKDTPEFKVDLKTGLKPEELKAIICEYVALFVRSATKVTKEVIDEARNLRVIGRAGVGLDNIDLAAATEKGIVVMNAPAGNTISTCEHTMSLILSLARNIPQANNSVKSGEWKRSKFMGVELYGKVLGIIGLGRIGKEIAKRALSFGIKITAYDPYLSHEAAQAIGIELVELDDLLKISDFITVHTPLTDATRHLISDREFALMKKGACVINCARGGIIDEKALVAAIKEGKISGASLDVFEKEPPEKESELLKLDNIITTPHLGASTEEAQINVAVEIAECVRDYLKGLGIRNAVNFPKIEPQEYKFLKPYIIMAERLGNFSAQFVEGRISKIEIQYSGEITKRDVSCLSAAVIKGLLTPILKEAINFINAVALARERGIKIKETKASIEEEFTNLISIKIDTDKGSKVVAATLSPKREPRIVKIDDFYVEVSPFGYLVVMKNQDLPGIIGRIGTLLGKHDINIAAMTFGRKIRGGEAISILNVDSPVSPDLMNEIRKIEFVLAAKLIKL
ncbi:MAG: phosphoglycerate dehydrogenase [Candidatus Omnitrophica bacterium]|nr:phosphoglycerate dehydrogenase [Candidatus Omnitrophota bacterium]